MKVTNWLVTQNEVKDWAGVLILNNLLLADYPCYLDLFDKYEMGDRTEICTRPAFVKLTFGAVFTPIPMFYKKDTLAKLVCKESGLPYNSNQQLMSQMLRYGINGDQYRISFECTDNRLKLIDVFSVLFTYGHYIEQRVAQVLNVKPGRLEMRKTSFYPAILNLGYREDLSLTEKNWIKSKGDQLAAYVNAYWLTWLFNIDLRNWLSGMVMDEVSSTGGDDPFVRDIWLKFSDYVRDRVFANQLFKSVGKYTLDCLNQNDEIDELELCRQIDMASYSLLIKILECTDKKNLNN